MIKRITVYVTEKDYNLIKRFTKYFDYIDGKKPSLSRALITAFHFALKGLPERDRKEIMKE